MLSRAPYYVALGLSLFALSEAHADGMRCGTKLIGNGDSMYVVESRCGSPDDKQHRVELRTERTWLALPCPVRGQVGCGQVVERTVEVTIDEWTYDFGPEKLIHRLIFQQGQLADVVTAGYGTKREP